MNILYVYMCGYVSGGERENCSLLNPVEVVPQLPFTSNFVHFSNNVKNLLFVYEYSSHRKQLTHKKMSEILHPNPLKFCRLSP